MSKVVLFSLILHLNAKVKRAIVKMQSVCEYFVREETSEWVRVFYWREKNRKSEYFCWFLRASKNPRGFLARAFQNFGDKKASKTAIFEIEKSEEKKNLCLQSQNPTLGLFFHQPIIWQFLYWIMVYAKTPPSTIPSYNIIHHKISKFHMEPLRRKEWTWVSSILHKTPPWKTGTTMLYQNAPSFPK